MRPILTIFLIAALAAGCKSQPKLSGLDSVMVPNDSTTLYFALKSSEFDSSHNKLDSFVNRWYSNMLYALREPVISSYPTDRQVYRFTWLRTRHHPISIRIESDIRLIQLSLKETNGMGGYDPGKLIRDTSWTLDSKEWTTLLAKLDASRFWLLPTEERDMGKDGAEWIVEGKKSGSYHLVSRWSPGDGPTLMYAQLCIYFLQLASLEVPSKQLY
jgi:hypothetical protein